MIRPAFAVLAFFLGVSATGMATAQSINCTAVPKTMPMNASVLAPVSSELVSPSRELSSAGGVLALAYDESQTIDQVLLRMRIESCKNVATVMPATTAVDPLDPATYKPKTEFDNTPWRFNMSQNGKNMTAEEFSAWMKARGVRVARGAAPAAVPSAPPAVPGEVPAEGATPQQAPVQPVQPPSGSPPGTLPEPPTEETPPTP